MFGSLFYKNLTLKVSSTKITNHVTTRYNTNGILETNKTYSFKKTKLFWRRELQSGWIAIIYGLYSF
jgi:hypothetical protein